MNELKELLLNISDSYYDFVIAVMAFAGKNHDREDALIDYIHNNPAVTTSDVILYMSTEMSLLSDSVSDHILV